MPNLPQEYHFDNEQTPAIIYHYCSEETFVKIVESKALWLTAIDKMNDYAEGNWLTHIVSNLCNERLATNANDLMAYDSLIKSINSRMNKRFHHVACFSSNPDLLSQWRGYANGGKGVAIGFNSSILESAMYSMFNAGLPTALCYRNGLAKIQYVNINNLRDWISNVLDVLLQSQTKYIQISKILSDYALLFKNPAFGEENEYRFAVSHEKNILRSSRESTKELAAKLKWRTTSKGLSSYFELKLEPKKVINNIVLGPLNKSEPEAIQAFLGKKVRIFRSSATYSG